ncbi:cytolytic toxin-alpha-like isoform X1 [Pseudophryne corroboree]|uniref:cytolytic toxin-alpha-like isoform X1 n=1 Tax=Pseudophryne corroboree TaxID=495146 RepID=UPI0030815052
MTIEMPVLGRPFSLGMLYDCRNDTLIPGITLLHHHALGENVASTPQEDTSFDIIASDTVSDKSSALDVSASIKASLLSGLIEVGGSASYLNAKKTSKNQARVTLKYSRTTRFEYLSMDHLGAQNMNFREVFDKGMATHVVTGIVYGAQAFFIFDREVSTSENTQHIQGKLQVMIQKIPSITTEGKGDLTMNDKDKEQVKKISCTVHGDFALESNPLTYEDAINIYTDLPKLLGEKGEKVVPVIIWLYPLRKLDSKAIRLVRDISADLVFRTEKVTQKMIDVTIHCNDLMRHPAAETFPDIKSNIIQFREQCDLFTLTFKKLLAQTLPSIRGGKLEEAAIADILHNIQQSPFNSLHITQFLSRKEQEMDTVSSYVKMLPNIKVFPSQTERNKLISDPLIDYVVFYNFASLNKETYLSDMCNWLQSPGYNVYENKIISPWFKDNDVTTRARRCVRAFQEFAATNASSEKTRFIISSVPDQSNPGVSIYLYDRGDLLSANFEPPTKPHPSVISGRTHDSMELTPSPADFGKEFINGYRIKYRSAEEEKWSHFITNKDQKITVTGLKPQSTSSDTLHFVTQVLVLPAVLQKVK